MVAAAVVTTLLTAAAPAVGGATAGVRAADAAPAASSDGGQLQSRSMMPDGAPDSPAAVAQRQAHARTANACAAGSAPAASGSQALGVDVASYQHPNGAAIDWGAAARSGQSFVVVKATEGTTYSNPYLTGDVNGARAAGIYTGAYHYARPSSAAGSAAAQASYFARAYNALHGNLLPPVLDLETTGGLSAAQLIDWTHTFLYQLQSLTGRVPVIYTGPYFWIDNMANTTGFTRYPLWVAHYTTCAQPMAFGGWKSWTFWQYNDGAYNNPPAVPGIGQSVDRNRFAGSKAQLAALNIGAFHGTASRSAFPDGSFVRVDGAAPIYRIAGLAPVYVSNWANVGGPKPVKIISVEQFYTLRATPLDGTFLNASPRGSVYRVAGGAPLVVTNWAKFGGVKPYVTVDAAAVDHAGQNGVWSHLNALPADGTFLNCAHSGSVYRVAGGAPLYVTTWSAFGGVKPYTTVDDLAIAYAGRGGGYNRLNYYPADGTFLNGAQSGAVYQVKGGHASHLSSWSLVGGIQPYTTVDQAAINNAGKASFWSHLR